MTAAMRAKFRVTSVTRHSETSETLKMSAVGSDQYPSDGSSEENTYARFTPMGALEIQVNNPDLVGKFPDGTTFYLDFTKIEPKS